jgi:excisionase family DNA binding protein
MTEDYRLLTCAEAAKLLRVRETTVRELVETGQLRAVRIGARYRIPIGALADLARPPAPPAGVSIPALRGVSILRRRGAPRGGDGA